MEFEDFIIQLKKRLKEPLPGEKAHRIMAPYHDNSRFDHKLKNKAKKSGVLLMLYQDDGEIYFPLIQRPQYDGVHSGQMALPGGKLEPGDDNIVETSLRETQEEIGVPRDQVTVIGSLTDLYIPVSNFVVSPVIGYTTQRPEFIVDRIEVVQVVEANFRQLLNNTNRGEKTIHVRQQVKIRAPYFKIGNKTVWGATAMILSEFAETAKDL